MGTPGRNQHKEKVSSLNRDLYLMKGEKVQRSSGCGVLTVLIVALASTALGLVLGQWWLVGSAWGSTQPVYDWGEKVLVDGEMQSVVNYFPGRLSKEDMKMNLE